MLNLDPQRALDDYGDSIYLREFVEDEESGLYVSERSSLHLKELAEEGENIFTFITTELSDFSSKIVKLQGRVFHAPSEESYSVFQELAGKERIEGGGFILPSSIQNSTRRFRPPNQKSLTMSMISSTDYLLLKNKNGGLFSTHGTRFRQWIQIQSLQERVVLR